MADESKANLEVEDTPSRSEWMKMYEMLCNAAECEGTLYWQRSATFLAANSALAIMAGLVIDHQSAYWLLIPLGVLGIALCVAWWLCAERAWLYHTMRICQASEAERALGFGERGMFLGAHLFLQGQRYLAFGLGEHTKPLNQTWAARRGKRWLTATLVPFLFAALWIGVAALGVSSVGGGWFAFLGRAVCAAWRLGD